MNVFLEELVSDLPQPDEVSRAAVADRARNVLRPSGALARVDEVAAWLAGWQRTEQPTVTSPQAFVFVADHGVAARGVSAYPPEVTRAMLDALEQGVATANALARALDVRISVIDVGVGRPTQDITEEDALDTRRFEECFEAGRAAVRDCSADLVVLGEMGIGNTTAAAAVCRALFGMHAEDWTGRGTGVDAATYARKVDAVEAAATRVGHPVDPIEILRRLGGSELVAIAGAIIESRLRSIPVILDGFVVTAAVAPLEVSIPGALDHCIAGHCSSEPGHRLLLEKLGKQPLIDLDLRLGEASGALLALPLVRLAAVAVTDVATFQERGLA